MVHWRVDQPESGAAYGMVVAGIWGAGGRITGNGEALGSGPGSDTHQPETLDNPLNLYVPQFPHLIGGVINNATNQGSERNKCENNDYALGN